MGTETTINTMEELYSMYSASDIKIALIAIMIGCLFAAFFSFRLFKFTVIAYGVCFGFLFGLVIFGLLTGDALIGLIVGALLAVIFGILSLKFCKIMIYLYGAFIGADIGYALSCKIFDSLGLASVGPIVGIIVGFALAMIGSFLLYRFFKEYTIIGTSITGSLFAVSALYLLLFGDNESMLGAFGIAWLVLSAVAMLCQFKMNKDYELEL